MINFKTEKFESGFTVSEMGAAHVQWWTIKRADEDQSKKKVADPC